MNIKNCPNCEGEHFGDIKCPILGNMKCCPFCGSPPELSPPTQQPMNLAIGTSYWHAGCSNRQCPFDVGASFDTREEAIEMWNTRPKDTWLMQSMRGLLETLSHKAFSYEKNLITLSPSGAAYADCISIIRQHLKLEENQ